MKREGLKEEQWAVLAPLLPPQKDMGRPRADDRGVVEAILYVLKSGLGWNRLPPEYGSAATAWRRLKAWEEDGTWERIWRTLLTTLDTQQKLEWAQAFLDGSFVPAKRGEKASG